MTVTKKSNIGDFRELNMYRDCLKLNKSLYKIAENFPAYEKNNLTDQLRRASVSVCANIAEGSGSFYFGKTFDRLNTAIGSLCECRAFLDIATMLGYINREEYRVLDDEAESVLKQLIGLAKRTEKDMIGDAS